MIKVGLLYGGMSCEHDVSLCSAASIFSELDKNKYSVTAIGIDRDGKWYVQNRPEIIEDKSFGKILKIYKSGNWLVNNYSANSKLILFNREDSSQIDIDFIIPALHGSNCEDGKLQGLLEMANVPYAGADVLGSSIAMDKDVTKRLLSLANIPVAPWITLTPDQWERDSKKITERAITECGFPLFIKPNAAGSSIGISKVNKKEELPRSILNAFQYDNKVLIEKGIDCHEIECSVLGNALPEVSIAGQIIPNHEFYSYESKYIDPNGARLIIPAEIDQSLMEEIRAMAVSAYGVLCCSGMARVDFLKEKNSNKFYLNEINTLPGFTKISMYTKLWEYSGVKFSGLLDKLIELGQQRHGAKNQLKIKPDSAI